MRNLRNNLKVKMIKRSELIQIISDTLHGESFSSCERSFTEDYSDIILKDIEKYLEPKLRPLTKAEIEEHPLVKQVHDSRKDEVRMYVANLDYEMKREYLPENE